MKEETVHNDNRRGELTSIFPQAETRDKLHDKASNCCNCEYGNVSATSSKCAKVDPHEHKPSDVSSRNQHKEDKEDYARARAGVRSFSVNILEQALIEKNGANKDVQGLEAKEAEGEDARHVHVKGGEEGVVWNPERRDKSTEDEQHLEAPASIMEISCHLVAAHDYQEHQKVE